MSSAKTLKRLLAFVISVLLILSAAPFSLAEEAAPEDSFGCIVKLADGLMMPMSDDTGTWLGSDSYLVSEDTAQQMLRSGFVEYVEPNYPLYLAGSSYTVNDPSYNKQWYISGDNSLKADYAWENGIDGTGVTVAVIDSGLDTDHEDLDYNTTVLKDLGAHYYIISEDTNGRVQYYMVGDDRYEDENGHGTAVTGVIAATRDNSRGITGAAPKVNILPIKVVEASGTTSTACVVKGIEYAIEKKVDVINISLAGADTSLSLKNAIDRAAARGILVICAAGNDAQRNNPVMYPAAYDNTISVGATTSIGTVTNFSTHNDKVWVTAPGQSIFTLSKDRDLNSTNYGYYQYINGTSFSSPCVAALAAMAVQKARRDDLTLTPAEFATLLKITATDKGAAGYDEYYGYGLIDAEAMLKGMDSTPVNFVLSGGEFASSTPVTYIPYYNNTVTLPTPTREGHTFGGWYADAELTGSAVTSFVPCELTGSATFYAKWTENSSGNVEQPTPVEPDPVDPGPSGGDPSGGDPEQHGDNDEIIFYKTEVTSMSLPAKYDFTKAKGDGTNVESLSIPITATFEHEEAPNLLQLLAISFNVNGTAASKVTVGDFEEFEHTVSGSTVLRIYVGNEDSGEVIAIYGWDKATNKYVEIPAGTYTLKFTVPGDNSASGNNVTATTVITVSDPPETPSDGGGGGNGGGGSGGGSSGGGGGGGGGGAPADPDEGDDPAEDEKPVGEEPVETSFTDVSPKEYYFNAVNWAVKNKITSGISETEFSPNRGCTRAQAVTFLWRSAGRPKPTTTVNPFKDVKPSDYYYDAVLWAVESKVTAGMTADAFGPNTVCSRAQIVTFQYRAAGSPEVTGSGSFGDVPSTEYYNKAVKWAVENKITSGTGDGNFSPNGKCTRGQIVTFLYRNRDE